MGKGRGEIGCELGREAGLAAAADTREREQARIRMQNQVAQRGERVVATDQCGTGKRHSDTEGAGIHRITPYLRGDHRETASIAYPPHPANNATVGGRERIRRRTRAGPFMRLATRHQLRTASSVCTNCGRGHSPPR
jgi:hypothetical protein